MKVCEQLTKKFRGCEITSLGAYYEIVEFMSDGNVLLYDKLLDQYFFKTTRDIATCEIIN